MEFTELINHGSKGTPRVWKIGVDHDTVHIEYGTRGGKMVETADTPGSKGKLGTKSYIHPEEQARLVMERKIKKQRQRGYISAGEVPVTELVWGGPQPSCLTFSKPVNNMPMGMMAERLLPNTNGIWTTKRNGFCHVVTRYGAELWIQTRATGAVVNEKYPHLEREFFDVMPHQSILLVEIYMGGGKAKADFNLMQEIANPHTKVGHALAVQEEHGFAQAYVYRAPIIKGRHVEGIRTNRLWIDKLIYMQETEHIHRLHAFDGDVDLAIHWLRTHGKDEEGLVCYEPDAVLGDDSYNFKGREDRPKCCWKLKQAQARGGTAAEDDFIAYWDPSGGIGGHCPDGCATLKSPLDDSACPVCGKTTTPDGTWGTGRYQNQVGGLSLYQHDKAGDLVYIADVASGLSAEDKARMANVDLYPVVVKVSYQDRSYVRKGGNSNALSHPVFESIREDKKAHECVSQDL